MSEKFHQRFGLNIEVEEVKRRFVNRVLNFLIIEFPNRFDIFDEKFVEQHICTKLGERWTEQGCLESLMGTDFDKCLRAMEALFTKPLFNNHPGYRQVAQDGVTAILHDMEIDIGIRWENGHFLPAGAPSLDHALVTDPLNLLNVPEYKGISTAFQKGLDHYLHSTKKPELLSDVITDMYEALEATAKVICDNDWDLSRNRETMISKLKLSDYYKQMLRDYIEYANKLHRHAGEKGQPKPLPSRRETEAFVYLTGLFIRLALAKTDE